MILDDKCDEAGLENIVLISNNKKMLLYRGLSHRKLMIHRIEIKNKNLHYNLRGDFIKYL